MEIVCICFGIECKLIGILICIYVGLEVVEDLIVDLEKGFECLK